MSGKDGVGSKDKGEQERCLGVVQMSPEMITDLYEMARVFGQAYDLSPIETAGVLSHISDVIARKHGGRIDRVQRIERDPQGEAHGDN